MPRTSLPPSRSSRRDAATRFRRTDEGAPPLYLGGVLLVAFFAVIVAAGLF